MGLQQMFEESRCFEIDSAYKCCRRKDVREYRGQVVQVDSCYTETINNSLVDVFRNEITREISLLNVIIGKKRI